MDISLRCKVTVDLLIELKEMRTRIYYLIFANRILEVLISPLLRSAELTPVANRIDTRPFLINLNA